MCNAIREAGYGAAWCGQKSWNGVAILTRDCEPVYTPSVAAAGIAAHEAGHALQDAEDYFAMEARTYIISSCLLHRIHDELHEIINVSRSFGRRSEPVPGGRGVNQHPEVRCPQCTERIQAIIFQISSSLLMMWP